MSMLAEPRRKLKWSVDPRNSAWSKDESKFGQKILERMGWSKGKGLGKSEQGATEHIKVKVKNNSLGLGTAVNNEDNWIAHQDDFNQLLAELNNCHGQNNSEEATQEQTQGFSLEEKSKTSRKRVHYMKFTKGKDLSSRSQTDLACIFGKRSKQTKDQDEANDGSDSQEEKEQDSNGRNTPSNPELELNTVTSTLTMQEYFAQRMAQLKKGQSDAASPADASNPPSPSTTPTEESPNTSDMEHSKKKRKKKRKDDRQEDEEKVKEAEEPPLTDEVVDTEQADSERKKKKKKKKKNREAREEDTAKECDFPIATDNAAGDAAALSTKKRKRKDKETPTQPPMATADERDGPENAMDAEVSHKKKKKKEKKEQLNKQAEVEVVKKKPKKDEKKKKNDH